MKFRSFIPMIAILFLYGCSDDPWDAVTKVRVLVKGSIYGLAVDSKKVYLFSHFEELGKLKCKNTNICQIHFWYDSSMVPDNFPMQDAETSAEVAVYQKNINTGLDRTLLKCELFPSVSKEMCF